MTHSKGETADYKLFFSASGIFSRFTFTTFRPTTASNNYKTSQA